MAKGKKKPASKPKVKKAEPIQKDEAIEVKKAVPKKEEAKKETPKVEKPKKEKKKKEKKIEEAPKAKAINRPTKAGKYAFPEAGDCKHPNVKRTIDNRRRVMMICTNPLCRKIVRFGSR